MPTVPYQSVSTRIRTQALAVLKTVNLPLDPTGNSNAALPTANIVSLKLPIDRVFKSPAAPVTLPAILFTPGRQSMPPAEGTTSQDDVYYPMLATIVEADNQEPTFTANLARRELWFERIARAFRNQRLAGVSEVVLITVEPSDIVDRSAWGQQLLVSAMNLKFHTREPRGLNVQ
jgi:hypothetical protein